MYYIYRPQIRFRLVALHATSVMQLRAQTLAMVASVSISLLSKKHVAGFGRLNGKIYRHLSGQPRCCPSSLGPNAAWISGSADGTSFVATSNSIRSMSCSPVSRKRGLDMMGKGTDRKMKYKVMSTVAQKTAAVQEETVNDMVAQELIARSPDTVEGYETLFDYYVKVSAPKQLLIRAGEAKEKGLLTGDLIARGLKAELEMKRLDLAQEVAELDPPLWNEWLATTEPRSILSVVRGACRAGSPQMAASLMSKAGLLIPRKGAKSQVQTDDSHDQHTLPKSPQSSAEVETAGLANETSLLVGSTGSNRTAELEEVAAIVYPNLVAGWFRLGMHEQGMLALEDMARGRLNVSTNAANSLIRAAQLRKDLYAVFAILDVMSAAKITADDATYEAVANAAVRNVTFITGAVSMATLPKRQLPEAAFLGRSNVGKSSLINMVCNRKALAYTSKRPGKTQQFNYFEVNGSGDGKGKNCFYIVDMPGHGYAKVPEHIKSSWQSLFRTYVMERRSLRVLFHLVDGRHGPVGEDFSIMNSMVGIPEHVRYVIVLTKADKNDNTVSASVIGATHTALRAAGLHDIPVVITSSQTKLGRHDMWRYLRLAALGGEEGKGGGESNWKVSPKSSTS